MKRKAKKTADSAPEALRLLWQEGLFKRWTDQDKIAESLGKRGNNFPENTLSVALLRAAGAFLVRRKKQDGSGFEYIQKKPAISKEVDTIEVDLFDEDLIKRLGKSFEREFADLRLNFGKSGNCSAFLLRKILEKLIYISFAKKGLASKLEDASAPGRIVGLEAMINTAAREKVDDIPFMMPKTAEEIRGIKFLGDASAHNPLIDVDMKMILPQMPFIIAAYKELARFF